MMKARLVITLFLVGILNVSCFKEYPFQREHLSGSYLFVDYRTVKAGPVTGDDISSGAFILFVGENGSVEVSGAWETKGKAIGLNVKLEPAEVVKEDGTRLLYEFGLIEGRESNYWLIGRYKVSGVVPNPQTNELVDYRAEGWFDARRK